MRRFAVIVGALSLVLSTALTAPLDAGASPVTSTLAGCSGTAYPPSPHATILASTTTPAFGDTIEASGVAYCANEDVRLTLGGSFVGTTHTDGTGSFDPPVKVNKTGKVPLCGIGASGLADDRDCVMLTVQSRGLGGQHGHKPSGGGGGTSFTGVDVLLLCLVAAVLLGAGWAFVAAGRKKRLAATRS
jgi:hypothetical protein